MRRYGLHMFARLGLCAALVPQLLAAATPLGAGAADRAIGEIKRVTAAKIAAATATDVSKSSLDAPTVIWTGSAHVLTLRDLADAPEMVVIPAGEFTMGSEPEAAAPAQDSHGLPVVEGPLGRKRIRIAYPFGFSKYPVTAGEFAAFVAASGYDAGDACQVTEAGVAKGFSWRNPGYSQTDTSPVVCVNYDDSMAYVTWLSQRTGRQYRLPSDSEYEYVNRGGTHTRYWWGDSVGQGHTSCGSCGTQWDSKQPAPVGSFPPNPFGVHDTTGNVWSRTRDCWNPALDSTPADGSANLSGDCSQRVFRGGGFRSSPLNLRSALRHGNGHERRFNDDGFHVVRVL